MFLWTPPTESQCVIQSASPIVSLKAVENVRYWGKDDREKTTKTKATLITTGAVDDKRKKFWHSQTVARGSSVSYLLKGLILESPQPSSAPSLQLDQLEQMASSGGNDGDALHVCSLLMIQWSHYHHLLLLRLPFPSPFSWTLNSSTINVRPLAPLCIDVHLCSGTVSLCSSTIKLLILTHTHAHSVIQSDLNMNSVSFNYKWNCKMTK